MKATKYILDVYESVLNFSHGHSTTITEIFIPELEIAINFHGNFRVFKTKDDRYANARKLEELELSKSVINLVKNYSKVETKCKSYFEKVFKK